MFIAVFAPAANLEEAIFADANRPVLQGTSWAAAASYANDTPLFSAQADLRLSPASTLKLLTSAAALEAFGPMHRFQTPVYTDAQPDADGIVKGNLYIRGQGDPTLGSSRVEGSLAWQDLLKDWSKKIRAAGIKKITGNLYADISLFPGLSLPEKTNWQNMGNYFAAPTTALAFNDNSFQITFSPQPKHQALVKVQSFSPQTEGLKIRSYVTASEKDPRDNAYVYAAPGQYDMEIYGTLPASRFKAMRINAALPDAPQLLADLLLKQLEDDGVEIAGGAILLQQSPDYAAMNLLFTHQSPPLKDIIYVLNKRSFNFYAEMLLRMLAVQNGKPATIQEGINQLYAFLQRNGISTRNMQIYDGSGLSRDNQITAQTLLDLLNLMTTKEYFKYYYNSLATPQDRGDLLLLRRYLQPFKRNSDVHVKGGTLDGVKAQAGYVKDKNGQLISFVFIANNLIAKDESINRLYEEWIKRLLALPS